MAAVVWSRRRLEVSWISLGTWVLIREEAFGERVQLMKVDSFGFGAGSSGIEAFLAEVCGHVQTKGVITLYSEAYGPASWAVRKTLNWWAFGTREEHTKQFPIRVMNILEQDKVMALVLRTYTDQMDLETGGKIKEIRGYRLWFDDGVHFEQIAAEEMAIMSRKDSLTGNDLDPEPAVVYCGPNGDRYDGWLRPR